MPKFKLIRELAAIIDGIPPDRINMDTLRYYGSCESYGCAIGWYALHPKGQERGLRYERFAGLSLKGVGVTYNKAAAEIFGLSMEESIQLFGAKSTVGSHKAEFRRRVIALLRKYNRPINPKY